ncbi:MAG: S4 domain-containing protein [Pseudohongiella sp.]|nr:S4 domain-containing protein [Pseudohongiella sp.]MDO9520493.1 S4 domain-containing protein [Pseudohongiella sp.]MDP2126499.1 S4 domain-containing protein [Pseudohongiella sp.]
MSKETSKKDANAQQPQKVRLDKWLWAARLFKTRALAKDAVEGGKVEIDGHKPKPGKEIAIGSVLKVRQGADDKTLTVNGLSEQRKSAPEAQLLYVESEDSVRRREALAEQRKLQSAGLHAHDKPNKKERRQRQAMKFWQDP